LRYYAAKELKKRGWMYNKKFYTFFQLQGTPKNKTDDFVEGKFKFFDFEDGWLIRQKKDWVFEFKYLDNIE
jgi:CCR4-NOT transcriptional regulation complex NOT5 subunit